MDSVTQPKRPEFLDSSNRYKLLYPIEYSVGEERRIVDTLQLRRLTLADKMILDEPIVYSEKFVRILQDMTGEMRNALVRMDAVDAERIDQIFGYFLQPGPVVGANF